MNLEQTQHSTTLHCLKEASSRWPHRLLYPVYLRVFWGRWFLLSGKTVETNNTSGMSAHTFTDRKLHKSNHQLKEQRENCTSMPIKSVNDPRKCRHEEQLWMLIPQTQPMRPKSHNPCGSQLSQRKGTTNHDGWRTPQGRQNPDHLHSRYQKASTTKAWSWITRYSLKPQKLGGTQNEETKQNTNKQTINTKITEERKRGLPVMPTSSQRVMAAWTGNLLEQAITSQFHVHGRYAHGSGCQPRTPAYKSYKSI